MPGPNPHSAVDAFLDPLREALACVGIAHFTLTPGARGSAGDTHAWTLNDDNPVDVGNGLAFRASMRFETLDRGQSKGRERFRVTTREYIYAVLANGHEVLAAHWHPSGRSPYREPHYHIGSVALSESGVYLERAHIPSPRVSFEGMIRLMISQLGVEPRCADWDERLQRTETAFTEHKSW